MRQREIVEGVFVGFEPDVFDLLADSIPSDRLAIFPGRRINSLDGSRQGCSVNPQYSPNTSERRALGVVGRS